MKLKEILTEIENEDTFVQEILNNCQDAVSKFRSGYSIYRGVRTSLPYFKQKRFEFRNSKDHNNFLNLYFDSKWNGPKRTKGICCSITSDVANYGTSKYIIFPIGNIEFGVCPSYDFVHKYNDVVTISYRYFSSVNASNGSNNLEYYINLIKKYNKNKDAIKSIYSNWKYELDELEKYDYDLLKYFDENIDPIKNGFEIKKLSELLNNEDDKEIWFDGDAYCIRDDQENMLRKLN